MPETSNVLGWIKDGVRAMLVEANPRFVIAIREYFAAMPHVEIVPKAVCDKAGVVKLFERASSSFVGLEGLSPAMVNDHYDPSDKDAVEVEGVPFSELDDGTIDLLSVDIEGGEWFVVKHLISRPAVVSVETHGKRYVNPHLREILGWFRQHDYAIWYRDKSDTVFVRKGVFEVTVGERMARWCWEMWLWMRRGVRL